MRRTLVIVAFAFVPLIANAGFDPNAIHQKYVVGTTYQGMGSTGYEARDIDGIPGDEILIGHTNMWQIVHWNERTHDFEQTGFFENYYDNTIDGGGLRRVAFAALDAGAPIQVIVLGTNGRIGRFDPDGTPHTPFWTPPIQGITDLRIANLDDQPGDEILLSTGTELSAWKFGASAPLWRLAVPAQPFLLAQVDADPQLEIVLGGGMVIDTKTLQTEWRYPIGFGAVLTTGDLNGDGIPEIIGCTGGRCDAYSVLHQTNLWEMFLPYPNQAGALAASDVDSDGRAEIFEGDSQHGSTRKIDGMTGAVLQQFTKLGGTNFILVADLRGDCSRQVVWAKNGDSTGLDTLHVTDARTMETFWSSVPEERGSSGIIAGDFSGTGRTSVLWSTNAGSTERFVSFDPPSRFYRQNSDTSSYAAYLPLSAAAQLDSDPALEYVLPTDILNSSIGVFDGATHQLQWSLQVISVADTMSSLATGDVNGDGVPDILVGFSIEYFPKSHLEGVVAVDGASRKVLWRTTDPMSHTLDEECTGCTAEVKVADLNRDGSKQVLALVPSDGLYAFAGKSGSLLWHSTFGLPAETDTAWAFTVADVDPKPGAEIIAPLVNGHLVVLDSSASAVLREKDLSQFGVASAVEVADLDGDGVPEIVLLTPAGLVIVSSQSLEVLWSGGFVLAGYSLGNQIVIADVDGDSTPEIVVGSAHSLRVFEYRASKPDTMPPVFAGGAVRATAATACCSVTLDWDAASDADSMPVKYRVYRSLLAGFPPNATKLVAETTSQSFVDRSFVQGVTSYYRIKAVDRAGKESSETLQTAVAGPAGCPTRRRAVQHN